MRPLAVVSRKPAINPLTLWGTSTAGAGVPATLTNDSGKLLASFTYNANNGDSSSVIENASSAGSRKLTVQITYNGVGNPFSNSDFFLVRANVFNGATKIGEVGFLIIQVLSHLDSTGIWKDGAFDGGHPISQQVNGNTLNTSLTYTLTVDTTTRNWGVSCSDGTSVNGSAIQGQISAIVTGIQFELFTSGANGTQFSNFSVRVLENI